jgi:hypothetical protein
MSTVDDAITHALHVQQKPALALSRGLRHKRQLRRYPLEELMDAYLQAVLRISNDKTNQQQLSLRRMTLAVQAMPVLLGGRIGLWERWAKEMEQISGALFLLRHYLPVRGTWLVVQVVPRVDGCLSPNLY